MRPPLQCFPGGLLQFFPSVPVCLILINCAAVPTAGQSFLRAAAESNVNQRYTIESVSIAGVRIENAKLPPSLRQRLNGLVGERCDVATLEDLAADLRRELHLQAVNHHLSKGSEPGQIRVNFDVVKKDVAFDVSVPKFLYSSAQGLSGEVDASTQVRQHELHGGRRRAMATT